MGLGVSSPSVLLSKRTFLSPATQFPRPCEVTDGRPLGTTAVSLPSPPMGPTLEQALPSTQAAALVSLCDLHPKGRGRAAGGQANAMAGAAFERKKWGLRLWSPQEIHCLAGCCKAFPIDPLS